MEAQYKMKYTETEEVVIETCKLYNIYKLAKSTRIMVAAVGAFVLCFVIHYSKPFGGSPTDSLLFVVKALIWWALAFVAGEIFSKTLGRRFELLSAIGDGQELHEQKAKRLGGDVKVRVEFFDDYFVNYANDQKQEFPYVDVLKLLESQTTLGLIVHQNDGRKSLFGFPKSGLQKTDTEELKSFLEKKCTAGKDGFVQVTYKEKAYK